MSLVIVEYVVTLCVRSVQQPFDRVFLGLVSVVMWGGARGDIL